MLCKEINEKKIIGRDLTDNEKNTISELAEEVDTNSNNRIDYEEFVALVCHLHLSHITYDVIIYRVSRKKRLHICPCHIYMNNPIFISFGLSIS